jgi:hypothetical protein
VRVSQKGKSAKLSQASLIAFFTIAAGVIGFSGAASAFPIVNKAAALLLLPPPQHVDIDIEVAGCLGL